MRHQYEENASCQQAEISKRSGLMTLISCQNMVEGEKEEEKVSQRVHSHC